MLDYKSANEKVLLADLVLNNPALSPRQIMQLFGLKQAFTIMSPRELRTMFAKYNQRAWYRLMSDANKVRLTIVYRPLDVIRKQLVIFKPFRLIGDILKNMIS